MAQPAAKLNREWPKIADQIAKFSIFEDFANRPDILKRFESILQPCEFPPDSTLMEDGTVGTKMYLLIRGQVAVFKKTPSGDQFLVAEFNENMNIFFGEAALLDNDTRSATIKTTSACECLSIDRQDFDSFSQEFPELALPVFKKIARVMMARLRKTNDDFFLIYSALVAEIRGR